MANVQPGEEVAVLETNLGKIVLRFFADKAPNHVARFKENVRSGGYDGTKFHRVIPGFMIQGGDPYSKTGDGPVGTGGMGEPLRAEFNDTKHVRGILSAARSGDPHSARSQFFLMVATSPHLDGQYTAYGEVVEGLDVLDKIVSLPRDFRDKPLAPNEAFIEKAEIKAYEGSSAA